MSPNDEDRASNIDSKPVATKEEWIAELQKEVELYEDSEEQYSRYEELYLGRIDFTEALLYGLFYGIIGNLAVQFALPVVERVVTATYDMMYWVSLLILSVSLSLILIATLKLVLDRKEERRKFDDVFAKRAASKLTKQNLKDILDYLKTH